MLGAINAHRVGYGLALVLAFSVGLAVALIVIGMGALKARDAMARTACHRPWADWCRCSRPARSWSWADS